MPNCYCKLKAIGLISLFVLIDSLLVTGAHQHGLLTYLWGYASSQKGPWLSKCEPLGAGAGKNGVDDRSSVHLSGNQIKVVKETRSKEQGKIAWDLDEQAIQLRRNLRDHSTTAEGRMGQRCEATSSRATEWDRGSSCGSGSCRHCLKGWCPQADFHSDGPASSEHQCQLGYAVTYRGALSYWSKGKIRLALYRIDDSIYHSSVELSPLPVPESTLP